MRMNTYEVKVNVALQQICEQDGSRLWWWNRASEREFIDKFLHEAEHRPAEMSLGEFIYRRGIDYFRLEEWDECERDAKARALKYKDDPCLGKPEEEIEALNPANHIAQLPDCREDDGKVEEFLKVLYRMEGEK